MTKLTIGLVCAVGLLVYCGAFWLIYANAPVPTISAIEVTAR